MVFRTRPPQALCLEITITLVFEVVHNEPELLADFYLLPSCFTQGSKSSRIYSCTAFPAKIRSWHRVLQWERALRWHQLLPLTLRSLCTHMSVSMGLFFSTLRCLFFCAYNFYFKVKLVSENWSSCVGKIFIVGMFWFYLHHSEQIRSEFYSFFLGSTLWLTADIARHVFFHKHLPSSPCRHPPSKNILFEWLKL